VHVCIVCACVGIIPLVYIELVASVLMFVLGIVLVIGINNVSSFNSTYDGMTLTFSCDMLQHTVQYDVT